MFVNKKENTNNRGGVFFKNEKYAKNFFFRSRRISIKKNFFNFFKRSLIDKKKIKNSFAFSYNRPDLAISPSFFYARTMFKTYKNNLLHKKLKIAAVSDFSVSSKLMKPSVLEVFKKTYFIRKKLYLSRLNFLNRGLSVPGKSRLKAPFHYAFKYLRNFKRTSNFHKNLFTRRRFDWVLVITTTNTNMYVNVTNLKGETVFCHTLRRVGFQTGGSSKRSSKVAVEKLGIFVGKFLRKKLFFKKKFLVIFKGISWRKRFILRYIRSTARKIKFSAIFERTGLAHNGCKLKKRKHKRKSFLKLHWMKKKLRIRKFKRIFKGSSRRRLLFKFNKYSTLIKFKKKLKLKFFPVPRFYWKKRDRKKKLILKIIRAKRLRRLTNKKNKSGQSSILNFSNGLSKKTALEVYRERFLKVAQQKGWKRRKIPLRKKKITTYIVAKNKKDVKFKK